MNLVNHLQMWCVFIYICYNNVYNALRMFVSHYACSLVDSVSTTQHNALSTLELWHQ